MKTSILKTCSAGLNRLLSLTGTMALLFTAVSAQAEIVGIGPGVPGGTPGTVSFNLTAKPGYVSLADGGSSYSWGYSDDDAGTPMQLPGPTLKVTQGDTVTIKLTNGLPVAAGNTSIVFPGLDVTASGGETGALTYEATPGGTVTYTFTALRAGTYQYHSGTQTDLQVEMGLYGALIVYPSDTAVTAAACTSGQPAYDNASTCYDVEYLYVLSENDIQTHQAAELQSGGAGPITLPTGTYTSEYWLMNGRVGPDTMAGNSLPGQGIQPSQPYGSLTIMYPGQRLLMRVVGAGREMHPFHHHGNHARMIAVDGGLLENSNHHLSGPLVFTIPSIPGQTADAIFEWSGKELGWDMYGSDLAHEHTCNGRTIYDAAGNKKPVNDVIDEATNTVTTEGSASSSKTINATLPDYDPVTHEWCADHGAEIPVTLPDLTNLAFGGFYSGSPYLGNLGSLPPGEGGLNPNAGFAFMWHSHTERELTNNDVFPGGMMTMLIVEPDPVNNPVVLYQNANP
jgi:hypothetical protein